jgi:dolichol-phosphate mannosyltransferase
MGPATTQARRGAVAYSVIVPTYNERENIPILAALLAEALGHQDPDHHDIDQNRNNPLSWELVVVDDASPDGTADAVRRLQACFPPGCIVLAERPAKLGLGSAYRHGLAHSRGQWVALMDADLSHHPRDLPRLIAAQRASGADVVSGTRYSGGGGVAGWDLRRKLTSRGANVLASALLGTRRIGDLTGAFRLYRRPVLEHLLEQVASAGYAFQMEAAARCEHTPGLVVAEVPIVFVDRLYGCSKLGSAEIWLFLRGLLRLLLTL